jgi:methanogenic corrinoid protein MtbC1
LDPVEILSEGLLKGVDTVSIEYEEHRATMAQLLLACRVIYAGLEVLLPEIPSEAFQRAKELKASISEDDGSDIGSGIVNAMVHTGALGESHL